MLGDERQLVTAVANLLANAVSYSPSGTQGRPSDSSDRASGAWVEISVADEGIGIAERDQERVFERFYRVDPARSRATGGTGLGLAIVKHVATNHGGEVQSVWSRPEAPAPPSPCGCRPIAAPPSTGSDPLPVAVPLPKPDPAQEVSHRR